jgi:DNA (cytosine-5)-methyltransferase 1
MRATTTLSSKRAKEVEPLLAEPENFSVISFFSGCGGLDLGFTGGFSFKGKRYPKLPFEILKAYDNDAKCVVTYKKNIGDHIEEYDLSRIDPGKMPYADVVIGGFPCQDFSSCGPKKGLSSKRGKLYQALITYMRHHKPKVVIGENVPHLLRINGGSAIKKIIADLRAVGYRIEQPWNLFAPAYGVPQRRRRIFLVAVRDDLIGEPETPTETHERGMYPTIDWAISDLENADETKVPNQDQYFAASRAKKGNGQGDEKSIAGLPAYTVRANAKSRVQFHYKLDRRLTVRECARLQTFPDGFELPHSATANIMQIGNAVPPVLGHNVAKSILDFLRKNKDD